MLVPPSFRAPRTVRGVRKLLRPPTRRTAFQMPIFSPPRPSRLRFRSVHTASMHCPRRLVHRRASRQLLQVPLLRSLANAVPVVASASWPMRKMTPRFRLTATRLSQRQSRPQARRLDLAALVKEPLPPHLQYTALAPHLHTERFLRHVVEAAAPHRARTLSIPRSEHWTPSLLARGLVLGRKCDFGQSFYAPLYLIDMNIALPFLTSMLLALFSAAPATVLSGAPPAKQPRTVRVVEPRLLLVLPCCCTRISSPVPFRSVL